jgi:outer membrane lipoprotein SlyB
MNANQNNAPGAVVATPSNTKPLWIAIGVLGASVLAMAATLVQVNKTPAAPGTLTTANALAPEGMGNTSLALAAPVATEKPMVEEKVEKIPQEEVMPAQAAPKKIARPAPERQQVAAKPVHKPAKPVARSVPAEAPVLVAAAPQAAAPVPAVVQAPVQVCASCGTVVDVNTITRKGKGSGVGAVAGGVLGGVLGHQVGNGTGKDLATIIGAVGGGIAGHQIERNVKKETVYQVQLRMDDGSTRTTEVATAPAVGAKVTVDGATLRSSDGVVYAPAPKEAAKEPRRAANGDIIG